MSSSKSSMNNKILEVVNEIANDKQIISNILNTSPKVDSVKNTSYEDDLQILKSLSCSIDSTSTKESITEFFKLALKIKLFNNSEEADYSLWSAKFNAFQEKIKIQQLIK